MYYSVKAVNSAATSAGSPVVSGVKGTVPLITGHPLDRTVTASQSAQFTVVAGGSLPLTYLWQRSTNGGASWTDLAEGAPHTGTATATLTVGNVMPGSNGFLYRAIVSNGAGSATSAGGTLLVLAAPTVSTPASATAPVGGAATFQVTVTGTPAPTLQWQLSSNGGASWLSLTPDATYGGVRTSTLTVSNLLAGYNGAKFRCIATNPAGSVTSAVATLTVGPPPTPTSLNLSRDLVTYGIAAQNLTPNMPSLDARPLFATALAYAFQHDVTFVTVDPGNYYFLSSDLYDRYLSLYGMSDLTIDLAGSTIFLKTGFLHGIILTECARMTLTNFTVDYLTPPYTHVALTSVDAGSRTLSYSALSGFANPTTFNGVASPYGPLELWAVVFRNGAVVPGTSRMRVQAPIAPGVLQLAPDSAPWTQASTLATLRAGDTIVLTQRGGGSPIEIFRGDSIVVSRVTVQGSSSWAVTFDQVANSTADGVRIVPRPHSGLIASNGDGIHFTSSRQNNHIRNSLITRTLDDAIAMDSLYLATVVQQTGPRQLKVRRSGWWRFPNGTSVNFVASATTAELVSGAVIVSQNPADGDVFNASVDLTVDRDLPALAAGDGMVFGSASQRGSGSTIANNTVADIPFGRGIWLSGNRGVTIQQNRISGTSNGGIVLSQDTSAYPGPPAHDIVVQDNQVSAVLGPMASGTGSHLAFAAIIVESTDQNFFFAHGSPNSGITLRRNFVADSGRAGIWVGQTTGGAIESNVIVRWYRHPELPTWGLDPEASGFAAEDFSKAIVLRFSGNVTQTGNSTVADSSLLAAVSVQPGFVNLNRHAASGSVAVQTNVPGLMWRARSDAPWLSLTGGQNGTGAGALNWTVSANTSGALRTGIISIADLDIRVTQSPTDTALPSIVLDKSDLAFVATSNGAALATVTPPQAVRLVANGSSSVSWSATSNQSWLQVAPASGTGTATLSVSVPPGAALPPAGTAEGTISISLPGVTGAVASMLVRLSVHPHGATVAPFGSFDTPLDGAAGVTGSIAVTGWTLDDVGVTAVRILRDPVAGETPGQLVFVGHAVFVEGARPDVAHANPDAAPPHACRVGLPDADQLPAGSVTARSSCMRLRTTRTGTPPCSGRRRSPARTARRSRRLAPSTPRARRGRQRRGEQLRVDARKGNRAGGRAGRRHGASHRRRRAGRRAGRLDEPLGSHGAVPGGLFRTRVDPGGAANRYDVAGQRRPHHCVDGDRDERTERGDRQPLLHGVEWRVGDHVRPVRRRTAARPRHNRTADVRPPGLRSGCTVPVLRRR